jgi:biotin transporter BioY
MKIANKQNNTKKSLLVLSFTVLIYLSSFFHISPEIFGFYNFAQYPIVLQNMSAVLAGVLLGGTQGAGAVGLYLVLGALGLPLFSKSALIQTQGFERLSGESGGFLVAYFVASLVSGLILKNPKNEKQDIKKIIKATVLGYALIWLLGDISWKNSDMSPDPVLLKTDGFPTYHLANVVDDHYMQISHVMRAQEWIPSTPLHVRMYHSFGWEAPVFCHLPMVNGSDGQKLSKRHGATNMNEFRSRGYLPQAIINYVAMLGCSYEEGRDLFPLEDLERLFKIEHLNKAGAVFDYKKLEWFNGQYIRLLSDEALLEKTS